LVNSCWYVTYGYWRLYGANGEIVIALSLTVTNTLAFSRCDKFGQASNFAGSALYSGGIASSVASGMIGRFFSRN
jgi:hypothetical protein